MKEAGLDTNKQDSGLDLAAFRKRYNFADCTQDCQETVPMRAGDVVSLLNQIVSLESVVAALDHLIDVWDEQDCLASPPHECGRQRGRSHK